MNPEQRDTAIGKTVLHIEREPVDPEYLSKDSGTVLVHFTDGSALKVEGASYESVTLHDEVIDANAVRSYGAARREFAFKNARAAAKQAKWLAMTCEQRCRRIAKRESKRATTSAGHMLSWVFQDSIKDMMMQQNRMLFGAPAARMRVNPCLACGERECENAERTLVPADPPITSWSVNVVAGTIDT